MSRASRRRHPDGELRIWGKGYGARVRVAGPSRRAARRRLRRRLGAWRQRRLRVRARAEGVSATPPRSSSPPATPPTPPISASRAGEGDCVELARSDFDAVRRKVLQLAQRRLKHAAVVQLVRIASSTAGASIRSIDPEVLVRRRIGGVGKRSCVHGTGTWTSRPSTLGSVIPTTHGLGGPGRGARRRHDVSTRRLGPSSTTASSRPAHPSAKSIGSPTPIQIFRMLRRAATRVPAAERERRAQPRRWKPGTKRRKRRPGEGQRLSARQSPSGRWGVGRVAPP